MNSEHSNINKKVQNATRAQTQSLASRFLISSDSSEKSTGKETHANIYKSYILVKIKLATMLQREFMCGIVGSCEQAYSNLVFETRYTIWGV
jgi:hypothetical protein